MNDTKTIGALLAMVFINLLRLGGVLFAMFQAVSHRTSLEGIVWALLAIAWDRDTSKRSGS